MTYPLYVSPEVIAHDVLRDLWDGEIHGSDRVLARIEALCGRVLADTHKPISRLELYLDHCKAQTASTEPCIHPGIFATDRPSEHCWHCDREIPRHLL